MPMEQGLVSHRLVVADISSLSKTVIGLILLRLMLKTNHKNQPITLRSLFSFLQRRQSTEHRVFRVTALSYF